MRLAAFALLFATAAAHAQTPADSAATSPTVAAALDSAVVEIPAPDSRSLDARLERAVYGIEARPFVAVMRGVNAAAYPAFAAAAPATAAVALVRGSSLRPALYMAAAEAGTVAVVFALKRTIRRPRPYRTMPRITDRRGPNESEDAFSFPSGHSAVAFSVATSIALSDRRLAVPAVAWAAAVGVSRMWHGVHYASDVLVGAAVGAGMATVAHALLPDGDAGAPRRGAVVPFRIVVPL